MKKTKKTSVLAASLVCLLAISTVVLAATTDFTADADVTISGVTLGSGTGSLYIRSGSTAESWTFNSGTFTVTNPGTIHIGSVDTNVKTILIKNGSNSNVACTENSTPGTSVVALPTTADTYTVEASETTACNNFCSTLTGAATYNAFPTCGAATCSQGYSLSGSGSSATCVASGGGGGGGGGSVTTTTTTTTQTQTQTQTQTTAQTTTTATLPSSMQEGNVVKSAATSALYLVRGNKIIPIPTMSVFNSAGLKTSSIKTVSASDVAAAASGNLIKSSDNSKVYLLKGDRRIAIPSAAGFEAAGFKWGDVVSLAKKEKDAFPESTLIKATGSDNVYVIAKGLIRHIPNAAVFNGYKYKWADIVIVTSTEKTMFGSVMLFKATGDNKVYFLDNGQLRWISSANLFVTKGYNWNNIVEVSKTELDTYTKGSNIMN
jgi:hypothetical protein